MKELVEYIAKSLVEDPSQVQVTEIERGHRRSWSWKSPRKTWAGVIGKDGRVANAMRVLVRVMASRQGKRVNLDIVLALCHSNNPAFCC